MLTATVTPALRAALSVPARHTVRVMPPLAAGLIVFFTSAAVLVLEILAGRLLAPYVGVTLETYTGIIGTVLAGIALGAWYGGRLADRVDPHRLLGPLVVGGGVLALFTIPIVTFFGEAVPGGGPLPILLLSFTGFFAPAAVLSAVTPTVIKIQLHDLAVTGQVVGRLSALGTAGAILGTFVTGFLLVATLPTRPIIVSVGILLVIAGLYLWWWLSPRGAGSEGSRAEGMGRQRPGTLVVLGLLAAALSWAAPSPCEEESVYYCARVEVDPARATGRILVLDGLWHSYVDLEDPTYLGFGYTKIFADVLSTVAPATAAPAGEPLDALHIGGGGFTMPRYLRAVRPGSRSLVLEIDPALVRIARDELGLVTEPDLEVRVGDGRLGVRDLAPASFDVVIGDAFSGLAVPWHLTTIEFIEQIRAAMQPDGIYLLNVIDAPPLGFARAEAATLRAAFAHVAVIAPRSRLEGPGAGNFVLVASDQPLAVAEIAAALAERTGGDTLWVGEDFDRFVGDGMVLRDDHAPVDQLLTPWR